MSLHTVLYIYDKKNWCYKKKCLCDETYQYIHKLKQVCWIIRHCGDPVIAHQHWESCNDDKSDTKSA